jgi:hypothetical protein
VKSRVIWPGGIAVWRSWFPNCEEGNAALSRSREIAFGCDCLDVLDSNDQEVLDKLFKEDVG